MKNSLGQNLKIQVGFLDESDIKPENKKQIELQTAEFKKLVWEFGESYFRNLNRRFIVDNANQQFLDIVCKYFANDKSFEEITGGELRKGLFIYGPCGTGKSSTLEIITNISKQYQLKSLWFRNISVHTVIKEFNLKGEKSTEKYTEGTVHFEDLGMERIAQSWGVKENLFERLLQIRYNNFKLKGTKTHITSNLTPNALEKHYGRQISDRAIEMFNFIHLPGKSRRY